MPIWKITGEGPLRVPETKLEQEKLLEERLEDWIEKDPSLLGESLMIIDRQVRIADVGDRLDILALDPQGNAVIVELKRGELTDPVDTQALRYAATSPSGNSKTSRIRHGSTWGNQRTQNSTSTKSTRSSAPEKA